MTQLYPPIIEGTIAAAADDGTNAILTVPFLMNKAVSWSDISGFALQIKSTGLDNKVLGTVYIEEITDDIKNNLKLEFDLKLLGLSIGQFYKAQLAYTNTENKIGYWSTVGVFKYTKLPNFELTRYNDKFIVSLDYANGDLTEKLYSYNFEVYYNEKLQDTSKQIICDNSQPLKEIKWQPNKVLQPIIPFYAGWNNIINIKFLATTINGLQININQEFIIDPLFLSTGLSELDTFKLNAENGQNYLETAILDYYENNLEIRSLLIRKKNKESWEKIGEVLNFVNYCYTIEIYQPNMGEYEYKNIISSKYYEIGYSIGSGTDQENPNENGVVVNRYKLVNYNDLDIEDGNKYFYGILYYINNDIGIYVINKAQETSYIQEEVTEEEIIWLLEKNYIESLLFVPISLNLEHSYLFDGKHQLKIKYNPKVSSFKSTQLEQKTNTMGGKFPFFYTNGNVDYKEFPISGLLSYLSDEEGLFDPKYATVNLDNRDKTQSESNNWNDNVGSTQLTPENIELERQFKMEVLDFLTSGKPMLFRSPTEGNYIVRLSNVSLSPNDTLGRMLHTFSATATECAEYNIENLRELGLAIKEA